MAKSDLQEKLDEALEQDPKVMMRDPFASIDAPYFTTEERNEQLALLEHLSRYSAMLFVIEGESGSGKTAFMNEFARLQNDVAIISRVKAGVLMSAGQLLERIYAGFPRGVQGLTPDASFGPLLKFAQQREEQAQTVLILIDEAHELSGDAISMLLDMMSLANENQPTPHVVLFSSGSLQKNMDPYLQSRFEQLAHTQTLEPFTLEQTKSYLLHRVRSVGGQINSPFSDSEVKSIFEQAKGLPGAINQAARKLLGKNQKRKLKLSFGFPLMHMALLSAIMLGILLVAVFQTPDKEGETSNSASANNAKRISSPTIAKIDQIQAELDKGDDFSLPPIPVDARVLPPTRANSSSRTPATNSANNGSVTTNNTIIAAPIALSGNKQPTSKNNTTEQINNTEPKSIAVQGIGIKEATNLVDGTAAISTDSAVSNNRVNNSATDIVRFDKAEWLLTQNPNRYSLQLLGAYTLSAVQDFIREQGSLDDFAYFKTVHNNRDWYVVVYGLYRNRGAAIAAIEELPRDLQALTPWARTVRGIQQDIRKIQ
ncbi:sporulation protein [Marinomonas agarivorans]|nr:sporulation protein [Marinomonas agarivorans]